MKFGRSAITLHGTKDGHAGVIILIATPILTVLAVWLNYRLSRKHQRQIDAIDAMKHANTPDHTMDG